ncbi:hypothetical protein [Nocardioides sp. Kera G14]|uniref:hypothetical protein n=1 Tax=Nocardioides sp. Kera G14 TaxID=2884264 RepID=UPI001D11990E|nr:hypothetical protein [Nocardioides sp. Kera G14]UDY23620.1 hypothetical protein LH076_16405 [Nocardioides sp. Kera G14]
MPLAPQLRTAARYVRSRTLDTHLRQVATAARRIEAGEVDVLILGDSTCLSFDPPGADRTTLPEMISQELGDARIATVVGPGFAYGMYVDLLAYFATLTGRPSAVVFPTSLRPALSAHVSHHPIYRYDHVRAELRRATERRSRVRWLGQGRAPSREAYAAFDALEVETRWGGRSTLGTFRRRLHGKAASPIAPEDAPILWDYFHGQVLTGEEPGFTDTPRLIAALRAFGRPAVSYWAPPALEVGERLFPGEFESQVRGHFEVVSAAFPVDDPQIRLLEIGLGESTYLAWDDGIEHYNSEGRRLLARAVAAELGRIGGAGNA